MRFNPHSIALILPSAFISSMLFSSVAHADGAYTVHPWEFREHRRASHRMLDVSDVEIYDYYYNSPQRSITHGLHPLNRRRYYNPRPYTFLDDHGLFGSYADADIYELDASSGRWVRSSARTAEAPVGSDCKNYSFLKPNYRVPPFRYRCQD